MAKAEYAVGETVGAEFQSACPRNNLRTEDTFLAVERLSDSGAGTWEVVSCSLACFTLPGI